MAAAQRLSSVLAHLNPLSDSTGRAKILQKNPDDIVRPLSSFSFHLTNKKPGNHLRSTNTTYKSQEGSPERHAH